MAQKYLSQDSLRLALEGDGVNMGFLDIADEYSGTKAGKTANYYAGVCYLNMGQWENAIEFLDKFKGNDEVLSVLALVGIGDAFVELDQNTEALEYYEKAIRSSKNDFVSPFVLFKAAQICELNTDYEKAAKYYKTIKADFKDSREASDIEKYIARAETKIK